MLRPLANLCQRIATALVLAALFGATPGCQQPVLREPELQDQAAKFGGNLRPREDPVSRWGISDKAQQIERNVGF